MVLVSHDHYDHLDRSTIKEIVAHNPNVLFIVPKGLKKWFEKRGITNIHELSWWESSFAHFPEQNDLSIQITAVPSQHFSGRGILNKNKTLWCGFVVKFYESGVLQKTMYFVGDTGYNPYDFKNIGEVFGSFDLSLIPIGTYLPYSFMAPVHICPEKAVKIHMEVNSKLSIGMHWKTFKLSEEMQHQPPFDLYQNMLDNKLDPLRFRAIDPGQSINW
ncbi:MAG: hypothetical protein S4CHLAM37_17000 [Chlamydiia bacterium]|nr:hypothetical protein [Chlamydiia bacterium]